MGLVVESAPTIEPVSLAEAKHHLRVDHSEDDGLIAALIVAARARAEDVTGLALLPTRYRWTFDAFPETDRLMHLPVGPARAVIAVRYLDAALVQQTLAASSYFSDVTSLPARIRLSPTAAGWPFTAAVPGAVEVEFTAGRDDAAAVPADLRQALLLMVGTWYETREEAAVGPGISAAALPVVAGAEGILRRRRLFRFT